MTNTKKFEFDFFFKMEGPVFAARENLDNARETFWRADHDDAPFKRITIKRFLAGTHQFAFNRLGIEANSITEAMAQT
jgi:hypothetical protein